MISIKTGEISNEISPQAVDKVDFSDPFVLLPSKRFSGAHFDACWSVRRKTLNCNGFQDMRLKSITLRARQGEDPFLSEEPS